MKKLHFAARISICDTWVTKHISTNCFLIFAIALGFDYLGKISYLSLNDLCDFYIAFSSMAVVNLGGEFVD